MLRVIDLLTIHIHVDDHFRRHGIAFGDQIRQVDRTASARREQNFHGAEKLMPRHLRLSRAPVPEIGVKRAVHGGKVSRLEGMNKIKHKLLVCGISVHPVPSQALLFLWRRDYATNARATASEVSQFPTPHLGRGGAAKVKKHQIARLK